MFKRKSHEAMRWLEGAVENGVVATSSSEESSKRAESLGQCGVSLEYIRLLHAHSSRVMAEETKTSKFINDIVVPLTSYKHRYGNQGDIHVLRCGRVRIILYHHHLSTSWMHTWDIKCCGITCGPRMQTL